MRVQIICHAGFEKAGYFQIWAEANQMELRFTHLHQGDSLPEVDDTDVIVSMGGPQSPGQTKEYPYLKDEMAFLKRAIAADKIVIGVCLGAQLIAESYGAKTEVSPNKEVGFFPLTLTAAGREDPLLQDFPAQFVVGHWHNDMPGLPEHARVLATSAGCPRQIIRFADKVVGLQCHFELDEVTLRGLIRYCADDLAPGEFIQTAEQILNEELAPVHAYLEKILNRLVLAKPR